MSLEWLEYESSKDSQKASSLNGPPFEGYLRWTWSVFAIWLRVLIYIILPFRPLPHMGFLTGHHGMMNRIGETAIPDRRRNNSDCWANTIQHRYPLWLAANDRVEALKNCRLVEQSREQHFLDTLFKGTIVWNSLELMCVIDPPKSLALHFLVYGAPSLQHPCKMWQSRRLCPPLVQHAVTKKMDQRNRKKCDAAKRWVLWRCCEDASMVRKVDSTTRASIRRTWWHVWNYIRVHSFVRGYEDCLPHKAGLQESEFWGGTKFALKELWRTNEISEAYIIESSDAIYLTHHPYLFRNPQ